MGASREFASVRQRCGGRLTRGGERLLIVVYAALASESLRKKWALGSKDEVKRKPGHLRQDWG